MGKNFLSGVEYSPFYLHFEVECIRGGLVVNVLGFSSCVVVHDFGECFFVFRLEHYSAEFTLAGRLGIVSCLDIDGSICSMRW